MKRYIYLSYALLGITIAGITVTAGPLKKESHLNGVLNAEYTLADNAQLNIGIDPTHVTQARISYGKPGIFGQKNVSYWIDHGKLVSRFSAAGETESLAQTVNTMHHAGVNIEASSIRVTPTTKQVSVAGHPGRVYHITARIGGEVRSWDAVLASGKDMYRLNKAWNRLIGELGPMQPSEQIAATLLAENLHPELHGYAPLKIGNAVELKKLQNDFSIARIYLPNIMNPGMES